MPMQRVSRRQGYREYVPPPPPPPPPVQEYYRDREPGRRVREISPPRGNRPLTNWEREIAYNHKPGVELVSVREVLPGDINYDKYLHGTGYKRVDQNGQYIGGRADVQESGYRGGPVREVVSRPVYDQPPQRIVTQRRPSEDRIYREPTYRSDRDRDRDYRDGGDYYYD